jgi:CRP/FNR family cyclic AMP-dependent transcriptional regulator
MDRSSSVYAGFNDQFQAMLQRSCSGTAQLKFPKDSNVYNCGDTDPHIYFIESGQVKTMVYSKEGKKCLLAIYVTGDILGELSLFHTRRMETATAMKPTVLRRLPVRKFRAALSDADLLDALLATLTLRLAEQQQVIANMVTMDSERRLAAVLLNLAYKIGKQHSCGIRIDERITQEELSGMVGTTRSRVGYFLKRFIDAGLVHRTPGSFLVIDEKHLCNYLDSFL